MTDKMSPFIPGARVALRYGHHGQYSEGFVDKVYKTGRFTLLGSKQQWRPSTWRDFGDDAKTRTWVAYKTGDDRYSSRQMLKIWDASTDAEIRSAIADQDRMNRFAAILAQMKSTRPGEVTEELVAALEAATAITKTTGSKS